MEGFKIDGLTRTESGLYDDLKQRGHISKHHKKDKHKKHDECNAIVESCQTHVHEFLGSTKLAEVGEEDVHNHRFAGVTSQVIPKCKSHVHAIFTNTDFFDHHHEIGVLTGLAQPVGDGKHIHFVEGVTTVDDGHVHEFEFATLIESPLT